MDNLVVLSGESHQDDEEEEQDQRGKEKGIRNVGAKNDLKEEEYRREKLRIIKNLCAKRRKCFRRKRK